MFTTNLFFNRTLDTLKNAYLREASDAYRFSYMQQGTVKLRVKNQSFTFQLCCNKAGRCKIEILYIDTIIILNNNHNTKQKLLYDLKKYKITYCERKSCKIIIHVVYYFTFILVIKWLDNHLVVINLLGKWSRGQSDW